MSAPSSARERVSGRIKLSAALFLSLLVLGAGAPEAWGAGRATESFDPVRKTQRVLVFNLRGVEPTRIIRAQARMRPAHKRMHRRLRHQFGNRKAARRKAHRRMHNRLQRRLNVRRVRNAANSGTGLRLRKPAWVRGGKVKVVTEPEPESEPKPAPDPERAPDPEPSDSEPDPSPIPGPPGEPSTSCDRFASPSGSDSAAGTLDAPYATPAKLVASLDPGEVGCLRAGSYSFASLSIKTAQITLRPYAGETAVLKGSIRVNPDGRGAVIEGLYLNGDGPDSKHGPNVYADDVVLRDNEITNDNTGICVQIARYYDEPGPQNVVVERNRIHRCGELPRTNKRHGIYNSAGINAVIRDNWIYANADRGIQLYPAAVGTLITGNVIDGNHHGLNFSCDSSRCSRNNVVEGNVIANSASWNVYGHSQGATPDGSNVLRDNCLWKSDGSDGVNSNSSFFSESGSLIATPEYRDRDGFDFSLVGGLRCATSLDG